MCSWLQESGKGLDRLAKRFRHSISLVKNGVSTCFGLDGKAAVAKYCASSAALVNRLDREYELAVLAGVSIEQAYDLYEAELQQNRCLLGHTHTQGLYAAYAITFIL